MKMAEKLSTWSDLWRAKKTKQLNKSRCRPTIVIVVVVVVVVVTAAEAVLATFFRKFPLNLFFCNSKVKIIII